MSGYHSRYCGASYGTSYYDNPYPLEDQCGDSLELAVEKFFTEAAKQILRQSRTKEKEFARVEKEYASLRFMLKRIEGFAKSNFVEEVDKEGVKELPKTVAPPPHAVVTHPPSNLMTETGKYCAR